MKLEVGMYVRTPYGIRKIVNITKDAGYKARVKVIEFDRLLSTAYKMDYIFYTDEHTIKNSKARHKIIDLIEVGDYVNGCYVSNKRASVNEHLGGHPKGIGIIKCNAYFNQGNYNDCKFEWIEDKDIKSIVTKEQFLQMEYKVGE